MAEMDFVVKKGLVVTECITLGGHSFDDIDIGSEFTDADDHIMSSGAIKEKIEDYGYTTATGDVTLAGTQTLTNKTMTNPNGSVSAPTFSFSTDTNSGMYRISDGVVGFSSNSQLTLAVAPYGISVGDGNSAGYVNAEGAQNLVLRTNDGTATSSVIIGTGTDSDVSITSNGTGDVKVNTLNVNDAYNLPEVVTGTNDYVLTAQTDGSTAWAAASGASKMNELTDVIMDGTNFGNGLLIQPDSDGSAPTTGTSPAHV